MHHFPAAGTFLLLVVTAILLLASRKPSPRAILVMGAFTCLTGSMLFAAAGSANAVCTLQFGGLLMLALSLVPTIPSVEAETKVGINGDGI